MSSPVSSAPLHFERLTRDLARSRDLAAKHQTFLDAALARGPGHRGASLVAAWAWGEAQDMPLGAWIQLPRVQDLLRFLVEVGGAPGYGGSPQGEALIQGVMGWMVARQVESGEVLVPTPGLAQRLLLTRLRGLLAEDVRLPTPTCYVVIPETLGFRIHNPDGHWHPVIGAYLAEDVQGRQPGIRVLLVAGPAPGLKGPEADIDDALAHFFIPLPEGQTLTACLESFVRSLVPETATAADRIDRNLPTDDETLDRLTRSWTAVFEWIVNVVFYATSAECEREHVDANPEARRLWAKIQRLPKRSRARSRAQSALSRVERRPRTVLGASVRVDRTLPRSWDGEAEKRPEKGSPLAVRVRVSGHWQRYAVGPGRAERKWIWRAPHWRGPKGGPEKIPGPRVLSFREAEDD